MNIRVGICDDQTLIRDGLRMQLGLAPDVEVVGEAADGEQAIALARPGTAGCTAHGYPHAPAGRHRGHPAHRG